MLKCLNAQKGVSVYFAIIIMVVVLGIGLGISTLLVGQIKMMRGMRYSVVAFYAADTGIERVLYAIRKESYIPVVGHNCSSGFFDCPPLDNGASYTIEIKFISPIEINSKGTYQGTHRAIEITY